MSEHYLLYLVSGLARKVETLLVRTAKQQHFGTTILKWEKHGVNEVSLISIIPAIPRPNFWLPVTWLFTAQTCRGVFPLAFRAFMSAP